MWRAILTTMSISLGACAGTDDPRFDSTDPVHCMAIFGIAANGAKQASNAAAADEMFRRASFLAGQQGGAAWIEKITPRSLEAGKEMEAAQDERATLKLLDECVAKQNADPAFQARMRKR